MECQDWVSITCPSVVHNTSVWSQDNWWYADCSSVLSYAWPKRKKTDDTLHVSIKRRSCWNNVKSAWATISWICKHIPRRLSTSTKLPERSLVTAGIYRHWKKAKEETATYDIYIYTVFFSIYFFHIQSKVITQSCIHILSLSPPGNKIGHKYTE